ncbi:MAG: ROK family protein [Bacteroidales bacterium]|nr:ROK family protein [Bacteroidales bacterium]
MIELVIGVDVGGTNTVFGFVDRDGNIYAKGSIPTQKHSDPHYFLAELHDAIQSAASTISVGYSLHGIGFGAPNGNYYNGNVEFAPNLPWKGNVNLVQIFKQYYDLPIFLTNDANAAAIGEMVYGGAKDMKHFIMITLGTGLGSGIVVDGKMVYGHDGNAGEIGHTTVYPDGRQCNCGRIGCLETYVSAPGVVRTASEVMARSNVPSVLREIPYKDLTSKKIHEAALTGDAVAMEVFELTGKVLGMKLADTVAYTRPEAFFLFGGLAQSGDLLLIPTKKYMEHYMLHVYKGKVKIRISDLDAGNAAILGASALVWDEMK